MNEPINIQGSGILNHINALTLAMDELRDSDKSIALCAAWKIQHHSRMLQQPIKAIIELLENEI